MQRAGTNSPQGSAYREEFAKIDRRERLRPQRWQGIPVTGGSHLLHQAVGKLGRAMTPATSIDQSMTRQITGLRARQD
jgi:hypothetical protein